MTPVRLTDDAERRLERMKQLREVGVNYADIARVLNLDFGERMDKYSTHRALRNGHYPRHWRQPTEARESARIDHEGGA